MEGEREEEEKYEYSQSKTSTTKILVTPEVINPLKEKLTNPETPFPEKFRCIFALENLGGKLAVQALGEGFKDNSALLRHEVAYCLGQTQDPHAIPILEKVLRDTKEEPIVRHEAGEALGAIGTDECYKILREFLEDPVEEVRETCILAAKRIEWCKEEAWKKGIEYDVIKGPSKYFTVDPAPALDLSTPISELREILNNDKKSMFKRYRALFSLRDIGGEEAIDAMVSSFDVSNSALLKHEVAYVLGQLADPYAASSLSKVLARQSEHGMVRHEAAEALGAIASDGVNDLLSSYLEDKEVVVKESCVVALDISYFTQSSELEYASPVSTQ